MAVTNLTDIVSGTVAALAATATASAAPSGSTDGFNTGNYVRVRVLLAYAGTVSTAVVVLWIRDRATGTWYRGPTTGDTGDVVLAPGGASALNEARAWDVGRNQEIYPQLSAVTGGGTVAIRLQPVDTGARW